MARRGRSGTEKHVQNFSPSNISFDMELVVDNLQNNHSLDFYLVSFLTFGTPALRRGGCGGAGI